MTKTDTEDALFVAWIKKLLKEPLANRSNCIQYTSIMNETTYSLYHISQKRKKLIEQELRAICGKSIKLRTSVGSHRKNQSLYRI